MRDVLPRQVFSEIQRHVESRGLAAEDGWEAGQDEEDTLTGHLGAYLQTSWSSPAFSNSEKWRWRVRYTKFRGRGPGAAEKMTGADGIIQIEVNLLGSGETRLKGILFQAKKGDSHQRSRATEQVGDMERLAPSGSALFEYREKDYRAIAGYRYLDEMGRKVKFSRDDSTRLGTFLGNDFLECQAGLRGMYYDRPRKLLLIPGPDGRIVGLRLDLGHRISIDVESSY